ncbi:hypothetical protein [Bacillus sp. JCM 19041]|uniref:hypothetical protein n=1 Tax=Bacillus sp. JCM 19041 TaxID=1460637 RepID=UPI000B2EB6B0
MISIILFLSVSYFTESLKRSLELSQSEMNYDIEVSSNDGVEALKNLLGNEDLVANVTASSINRTMYLSSFVNEENASPELIEHAKEAPEMLVDGQYPYDIQLVGMEEDSFKTYAEQAGINLSI